MASWEPDSKVKDGIVMIEQDDYLLSVYPDYQFHGFHWDYGKWVAGAWEWQTGGWEKSMDAAQQAAILASVEGAA